MRRRQPDPFAPVTNHTRRLPSVGDGARKGPSEAAPRRQSQQSRRHSSSGGGGVARRSSLYTSARAGRWSRASLEQLPLPGPTVPDISNLSWCDEHTFQLSQWARICDEEPERHHERWQQITSSDWYREKQEKETEKRRLRGQPAPQLPYHYHRLSPPAHVHSPASAPLPELVLVVGGV